MTSNQKAILAGGCFWGLQDLIRNQPGVVSTLGWVSGRVIPTQPTVTTARTRSRRNHLRPHGLPHLLEFFFQIHDPTTKDRQAPGTSYRSVSSTSMSSKSGSRSEHHRRCRGHPACGRRSDQVSPAGDFWEAEPEHQGLPAALLTGTCRCPARLEAADRRICCGQPFTRTRDLNAGPSCASTSAHHHPTAVLRGDATPRPWLRSPAAVVVSGGAAPFAAPHPSPCWRMRPRHSGGSRRKDPTQTGWRTSDRSARVEAIRLQKTSGSPVWAIVLMMPAGNPPTRRAGKRVD